jgi:hypothetical protein
MNIKKNQFIFYYPYNWSGHITEEYSGKYAHCTVAWTPNILEPCYHEFSSSPMSGITFRLIDRRLNFDVYNIKPHILETMNLKASWDWAEEKASWCKNHPIKKIFTYDYLGLIGYLFQNPKLNKPDAYFCSELLDIWSLKAGIDLRPDLKQWNEGPTDIANSNLIDFSWSNRV